MISVSVIGKPWKSCRLVLNAYSGLVPMSPYTTPSTASSAAALGTGLCTANAVSATPTGAAVMDRPGLAGMVHKQAAGDVPFLP